MKLVLLLMGFLFMGKSSTHDAGSCKYLTIPICGNEAIPNTETELLERGPPGVPGKKGSPGRKGDNGDKGDQGVQGDKGDQPDMAVLEELIRRRLEEFEEKMTPRSGTDLCKTKTEPGIYQLYGELFVCDGEGWTVIQRRRDGSINFERNWSDYSHGFGSLDGEFWLGLQTIHKLTRERQCKIRIDMATFEGEEAYAEYSSFRVADEGRKFSISISGFSGNGSDSMVYHNEMKFTTIDNDNDRNPGNCSPKLGGWWYNTCFHVSLNGVWGRSSGRWTKILWYNWKGENVALEKTTMKIKCE